MIIKNTLCFSIVPITVQAVLRARKLALHSNLSYGYAFRSRAALTNTSPPVLPGGEMIAQGFTDQVRARPSGETGGLCPAPAPVILVRNAC